MSAHARIGDVFVGVCCCHPPIPCIGSAGVIVTGASNTATENSSDARVGDIGIGFCGHPTVIVSGSGTVSIEGNSNARVGDAVAGCITGIIVTGASKTTNSN